MKKIEEIQNRKVMSAYGGVQSIIETAKNGSLLVSYYDQWPCFNNRNTTKDELKDPRLLNFIKTLGEFHGVQKIRKVPTPDLEKSKYKPRTNELGQTIMSGYFPGWFFCPQCRQLHTLDEWKKKWDEKYIRIRKFNDDFPACCDCSKPKGQKISPYYLEQVRFLLASADSGKIIDIPFKEIWTVINESGPAWIMDGKTPTDQDLFYYSSAGSDGLQSIYVKNKRGDRISLAQIAAKYIVYTQGEKQGAYKLCLRNQNNIYYPQVINSLYIPFKEIDKEHREFIIDESKKGRSEIAIYQTIQSTPLASKELKNLSVEDIKNIINNGTLDYDTQEFAYIINPQNYSSDTFTNDKDDAFIAKKYPNIEIPFVKCMYTVLRLKMTSVVPYFSRISTPDSKTRWWDVNKGCEVNELPVKPMKTYSNDNGVTFIPGVESYGEGIFFEMDVSNIQEEDRKVFVHTYSHMIMKELEFQCGYPLSSLKEKVYSKDHGAESGVLIYTVGGAEGSFGGLVSLFPSNAIDQGKGSRIVKIIKYAMERVKDCPNDPICSDEEQGHCYACLDLPEISCCLWNQFLDRRVFLKYSLKLDQGS